jgi:hypothetical protein
MKLLLALAVFVLVGCEATMPQQPAKTTADDPSRKCFNSLGDDPQLAVLHSKVGKPNEITSTTLEMLSNKERAAEGAEKKAVQYWAFTRNACVEAGKRFREIYQPVMYTGLVESQNEAFVVLLSKLYSGEYTYGEFNVARKQVAARFADAYRVAQVQEQQSIRSNQQARAAQQAQASADFTNAMMLLQAAQPRPAPAPILPPSISCSSRNVGGTVYTDCR